jgi:subtilisin family serine protease
LLDLLNMLLLLIILLVPYSFVASLAPLHNAGVPNSIPNQYLVVLHTNSSIELRDSHVFDLKNRFAVRAQGEEILASFNIGTFIGFSAIFSKDILSEQLEHPNVLWVEQDQIVTIADDEPEEEILTQTGVTWGIDRISQRNLPLDNIFQYWESAGSGVVSYVVDTGILTTHTEYAGRAFYGSNYVGDGNTGDGNGHGTHVAGTIGGNIYGLAKKTTLVSVIVLNSSGSGSWTGVVSGVQWTVEDRIRRGSPKSVANMSLGGGATPTADAAVAAAIEAGVNYAIAAGNSNADACNYSPARVTTALTVGATTNTDARASFSNFGTCVDIFAPGNAITSAWIGSNTATSTISGTSMAAPHVAGAVALHLGHITTTENTKETHDWINNVATYDVVTNPSTTPNRFLYSPIAD